VSVKSAAVDARREPLLLPGAGFVSPRLPTSSAGDTRDKFRGRREPPPPATASDAPPPDREPPLGSPHRARPIGTIGSLVLHLLPLLLLVDWPLRAPPEATPIPVQLVFQPPPPPPDRPKPEVRPPPGRLASEDIGDPQTKGHAPPQNEETAKKQPEPETRTAAVIPPLPQPATSGLPDEDLAKPLPLPKPKPSPRQPQQHLAVARTRPPARPARYPGPSASRDEYLAYLVYLTKQHLNLLPMSVVGGRRGMTVIDIVVRDDGTLAFVHVGQSSGYPDIDRRVEAMIAAVGRFPPLPQWFQGPSTELKFSLRFPDALAY
jgi:protein TonB